MASRSDVATAAFAAGMIKAAAGVAIDGVLDTVMGELRAAAGDTITADVVLDDALPDGKTLEAVVTSCEHDCGVVLTDAELARLFAGGTARDLARMLSSHALKKTAEFADPQARQRRHQQYLMRRPQLLAKSKAYRMAHMNQIRRRSRAYRRKVKRKIVRPKKRVGTAAGGYSFIQQ